MRTLLSIIIILLTLSIIATLTIYRQDANEQPVSTLTIDTSLHIDENLYKENIIEDTEDFYALTLCHRSGDFDMEGESQTTFLYVVTDGEDIIIIKEIRNTTADNGFANRATLNIKDISLLKKLDSEEKFTYIDNLICNCPNREIVTDGMSNQWIYYTEGFNSVEEEFQYYVDNKTVTPIPIKHETTE